MKTFSFLVPAYIGLPDIEARDEAAARAAAAAIVERMNDCDRFVNRDGRFWASADPAKVELDEVRTPTR